VGPTLVQNTNKWAPTYAMWHLAICPHQQLSQQTETRGNQPLAHVSNPLTKH
jgi:hypothetical protein